MNKGKKALALFLTAVMAMSALSGCGDNGGSSAAGSSTPASSASTAAGDSNEPVTLTIGIKIDPDGIHVMKKSAYSGMFGDYSSFSEEYDELDDATLSSDEEESGDEE